MSDNVIQDTPVGVQIKTHLLTPHPDGFKRTQRWLAKHLTLSDARISNKLSGVEDFTPEELKKINKILRTDFK
jgi:ParB-like chromosome segregation protein Spo0J